MTLSFDERLAFKDYLTKHFNLDELKDLVFALGINYENIPHATASEFARELILCSERLEQLPCLMQFALKQRPSDDIAELLVKLAPCDPRAKVIIIVSNEYRGDLVGLKAKITALAEISWEEVSLIAAMRGSIHVLVGLPRHAADKLIGRIDVGVSYPDIHIELVVDFERLSNSERERWAQLAKAGGGNLEATITGRTERAGSDMNMGGTYVGDIRDQRILSTLSTSFNIEDLASIYSDLGVDYETLGGDESLTRKAQALIQYLDRQGRLDDLIRVCQRYRPDVIWK
jgi:hypothetical protein